MSEPKRGKHDEHCMMVSPSCACNTCQFDCEDCCFDTCPELDCPICYCDKHIKDEPTKKGAADV